MGMPCTSPKRDQRCEAITDLIESVAKQEDALAEILDAEADKLKKVVGMHDVCPEKLLAFNSSVEQTIRAITDLENVLRAKLELFKPCLCFCQDHDDKKCDKWDRCDKCDKCD